MKEPKRVTKMKAAETFRRVVIAVLDVEPNCLRGRGEYRADSFGLRIYGLLPAFASLALKGMRVRCAPLRNCLAQLYVLRTVLPEVLGVCSPADHSSSYHWTLGDKRK